MNLDELVGECRREVEACAGPPPSRDRGARDPLALSRWRLHAALEESLRLHADSQAAVEVTHYVVVPFLARQHVARAAFASWRRGKLPRAPLQRTLSAHRRAVREHLGRVDALRSELEAEGMATELLDGEQVVALLWSCFNPTRADRREPARAGRRAARRARRAGRAGGGDPGGCAAAGGDRLIEPRLRPGRASRACRPGRRADDRGRDDRGTDEHGLAARGDADPPAVLVCACTCTRSSAAASASG